MIGCAKEGTGNCKKNGPGVMTSTSTFTIYKLRVKREICKRSQDTRAAKDHNKLGMYGQRRQPDWGEKSTNLDVCNLNYVWE
jgi:hypothetical protein